MSNKEQMDELLKAVAGLSEILEERNRLDAIGDIAKKQQDMRKGEFSIVDTGIMDKMPPELQKKADELYIASVLLKKHPSQFVGSLGKSYRETKPEFEKLCKANQAMDTADAGYGMEWVPTQLSANLIDRVDLELLVAALHERFIQPTPVYEYPILGGKPTPYKMAETLDDADTNVPTPSTSGSNKAIFTAVKMACEIRTSTELTEDAVFPVLPRIRMDIAGALAEGQEDCLLNGDDSGSHMDTDITSAADIRKCFKGYRYLSYANSLVVDLSTFNLANLRKLREAMLKYGVKTNNLAWVVGLSGYNKMLGLSEVTTVDKYGANATILTGEVGKIDNIPIILTGFTRTVLTSAGIYGAAGNKTCLHLVYKPGFAFGDRRQVTLKADENIHTDQQMIVGSQRISFNSFRAVSATDPMVVTGINFQ